MQGKLDMFEENQDNILLKDDESQEKLIFHQKSFLTIIYGIMTHYLRFKPEFALQKIENWSYSQSSPTYSNISLLGHELEYDWAMVIAYGNSYSQKGYNTFTPVDYDEWLGKYISKNNLKPLTIEYLD